MVYNEGVMQFLKNFLNNTTMYRLMLYYLLFLAGAAIALSFLGILPYSPWQIMSGAAYLWLVCYLSNIFFAWLFGAKPNLESRSITALILTLLVGPMALLPNIWFLTLAAATAMASKYVIAFRRRHIFNPAAFAVVFAAIAINQGASWWVGNVYLLPFVILGGVLMIAKIRRWHLVGSFLASYLALLVIFGIFGGREAESLAIQIKTILLNSPILFFSFVMLPEPLTDPPDRSSRIYYGILIAVVYSLFPILLPTVPYGLELSLLIGNVFARVLRFDPKFAMKLVKKEAGGTPPFSPSLIKEGGGGSSIMNFWFEPDQSINFMPGQFLEWTLAHPRPDSRGARRYFTIASAPEEKNILLTTKFAAEKGSSFKEALKKLSPGQELTASNLEGEFILPKNAKQKLCFIAGGIGITPFRSMLKYMIDAKKCRDAVLLYSVKSEAEIVYKEIFEQAKKLCDVKVIYVVTDKVGFIDKEMIEKEVPNFVERLFFVSGPEPMVKSFEKMLAGMNIPKNQIKHDYFPGY